ncbi:MAG TPA: hypothetical protein VK175_07065 [Leadbetterella sp.]|nr:hypothetical protein [Leadbetterella sp.]
MRYFYTFCFCIFNLNLFAQRYYERDTSPLADGETVLGGIGLAICFFLGAYLLFKFSDNLDKNRKENSTTSNIGCLGSILGFIGLCCLYPLLHWVEVIGLSIFYLGIIFIIGIVVLLIVVEIIKSFFK